MCGMGAYRFDWPRANFLTFRLFDPRGVVRLALGAAFLRAARFSFLRSSLSSILVVFATCNLFHCYLFNVPDVPVDVIFMVTAIKRSEQWTVISGQGGLKALLPEQPFSIVGTW